MRLGVNAGSSRPLRYLLRWSEPVAAVKRKNVGWRRKDAQPVLKSLKGWMRSSNSSRAATSEVVVATVKPPALMETLQLPQQAARVRLCPPPPLTSASPHPPVWMLRSLRCWPYSRGPVRVSVTDSEPAATAASNPVQVSLSSQVTCEDWFIYVCIYYLWFVYLHYSVFFMAVQVKLPLVHYDPFQLYNLLSWFRCSAVSPAHCVPATAAHTGHTFTCGSQG